jgi:predicted O-linked N-acetylglucosamine transferase (SPINDLY family)
MAEKEKPGTEDPATLMRRAFPLHQSGEIAAAEALYLRILALTPEDSDAQFLLGRIAQQRGELVQAVERMQSAIRSNCKEPEFHRSLGAVFLSLGRWSEAADSLEQVLALDPADAVDWNRLGQAYWESGDMEKAQQKFERAYQIAPDTPESLSNIALVYRHLGLIEESLALLRRARSLAADNLGLLSGYLFTLNLSTRLGRQDIFREHLECDRLLGAIHPITRRRPGAQPGSDKRLRICYLSPDLRYHSVSLFVEPLLAHHDRSRFEISCYYAHPLHDDVSRRLRQLSDRWVDCAQLSDAEIAKLIASDGIDILVDLAGHTDGNRIAVLAHRPAPVVATWLGYLNTTGLRAVDYRITDRHTDPPGTTEQFHAEALIRLPDSQWCRQKPDQRIDVSPLPAAKTGAVCFGSFNKSSKLTRETLALWGRVLLLVPGARILFAGVGNRHQCRLRSALADQGVDDARLEFVDRLGLEQFRELHHRVDVALDPYPYSGATTTLDSLWMGVPVLTLAGNAPISRSTASILATIGLPHWIAHSEEEFVELAVRHTTDLAALAVLRSELRDTLEKSTLMDGARFTRQLEESYIRMWRERGG